MNSHSRNRRKISNFVISPTQQLGHYFPGLLQFAVLAGAQTLLIAYAWREILKLTGPALNENEMQALHDLFFNIGLASALTLAITGIACFCLFVIQSHRIFGPLVPIIRHIDKLGQGNYADRLTTRKGDRMDKVVEALNDLTEKLRSRK